MTQYPSAPPPGSGPYGPGSGAGRGADGPGRPEGEVPVCPRHPDRVSYVTCQRCGRPACPQCQRPAAVGVHCVDCVAAAQRSIPARRTVVGAPVREGRPMVTLTLMALCIGVHLLWMLTDTVGEVMIFWPGVVGVEQWRMITTAFLHAGLLHLAVNMVALWVVGPFLEKALGRWRFLSLYLLSALGGSVAVVVLTPISQWGVPTVGASGAVFGLFAAAALMLRRLGGDFRQILFVIAINVVISFTIPRVSWQAHLGGLVIGAVLTLVFLRLPKKWRLGGAIAAIAGLVVALGALTAAVYPL